MSFIRVSSSLVLGAVLFFTPATQISAQEDSNLFEQGMVAFHNGNFDLAQSKFREVISENPSNADALLLLHQSQDALLELLVAGGEFEVFAREILASARAEGRTAMRDTDAAAKAAEGCFSESYQDRAKAIFALHQNYGPFAAVPLVHALGDSNESRRLAAVYALSRMGANVVMPLMTAARSSNTEVRLGALHALNVLNDNRASALISDLAANDTDGSVRALASEMLQSGASPSSQLIEQAWSFFNNDANGLSSIENHGAMFSIDGRNLVAYNVPQSLVAAEWAKRLMLRANELGTDTSAALAVIYASEVAILSGIDGGEEQAAAQRNALLTLSTASINSGLEHAVANNMIAAAQQLISVLDGAGNSDWSGLYNAMGSSVPMISHSAAVALSNRGQYSAAVVQNLAAAVRLESKRIVHIIDGDSARANDMKMALGDMGVSVIVSSDGASGLVSMHLASNVDAFVIAEVLPDLYASRVSKSIKDDSRFSEVPIYILGEDMLTAIDVVDGFGDLSSARQAYADMAAAAATALLHPAHADAADSAVGSLVGALNRQDSVAVPSIRALGFAGASNGVAHSLLSVLADTGRSSEVRVASANALSNMFAGYGIAADAAYFQSAMTEGDANLSEACARAIGVMSAGHISAAVSL
ncbi:MAG: HEAT repeat domain-containing protein [Planctomycetota bacterium]|nr:HEAT repeat domain-containing protein [Planctomycetota bacterium]